MGSKIPLFFFQPFHPIFVKKNKIKKYLSFKMTTIKKSSNFKN